MFDADFRPRLLEHRGPSGIALAAAVGPFAPRSHKRSIFIPYRRATETRMLLSSRVERHRRFHSVRDSVVLRP